MPPLSMVVIVASSGMSEPKASPRVHRRKDSNIGCWLKPDEGCCIHASMIRFSFFTITRPREIDCAAYYLEPNKRLRRDSFQFATRDQCVEGFDDLAGLQLPLKEVSRHVEPSERVMHSMTTRSDGTAVAETVAVGAERVYPSNVFS